MSSLAIAHDQVPLTEAARDNAWETVTRNIGGPTGSDPRISAWPALGAQFGLWDLNLYIGNQSLATTSLVRRLPIKHEGQLLFCSRKYLETTGSLGTIDGEPVFAQQSSSSPAYSRVFPLVIARKATKGWDHLSDESSFGDADTDSAEPTAGLISWEGSLYIALLHRSKTGGTTGSGAPEMTSPKLKIFRHTSGTTWEDMTPTGLPTLSDHLAFRGGDFCILDGSLYFFWDEIYGSSSSSTTTRLVASRLETEGWSRKTSVNIASSPLRGISNNGSKAWFWRGSSGPFSGYFPVYTPTLGFSNSQSTFVTVGSSFGKAFLRQIDGTGCLVGTTSSPTSSYSIIRNTSGTTWTTTTEGLPLPNMNLAGWQHYEGKEYVLVFGQGPGMTSTERGLWLFRKDGTSWTELGGGSARLLPNFEGTFPGWDAELQIVDGKAYVLHREAWNSTGLAGFVVNSVRV